MRKGTICVAESTYLPWAKVFNKDVKENLADSDAIPNPRFWINGSNPQPHDHHADIVWYSLDKRHNVGNWITELIYIFFLFARVLACDIP